MAVHSHGQVLSYRNVFLKIDQGEGTVWTNHGKQNNSKSLNTVRIC